MPASRADEPAPAVWTIGHMNHSADRLLELPREHGITAIAGVRTSPHSAYSSQFNREQLLRLLESPGVRYVFLETERGGQPTDPALCRATNDRGSNYA
jgi:uncharacterized protein (DUF488 family)